MRTPIPKRVLSFLMASLLVLGSISGDAFATSKIRIGVATLTLASAPVLEGKRFLGWYKDTENEETKMNGGEEVTEDLTLAAKFDGRYKVVFLTGQEDGTSTEVFSQYYDAGEPVGTLPAVPFKAGMDFVKWVVSGTDTEVTAETTVTGDMTVEAVFESIHSYTLTVRYWYKINETDTPEAGGVVFNTDTPITSTMTAPGTESAGTRTSVRHRRRLLRFISRRISIIPPITTCRPNLRASPTISGAGGTRTPA